MSSSTKSKGRKTNESSKIDPKDAMPKVTSTTENNSKGARSKTSSKPEESKEVNMSSSTKSKPKGTDTNENLKNDPKDVVPKAASMTENNSKGARPKTSLKKEESSKVTKKTPLLQGPERTGLKVLIMNVSGDSEGEGTARRRKQVIQNVIRRHKPDVILFQEFKWKGIHGKTWSTGSIPKNYQYTGNDEASILFNINVSTVVEKPIRELKRILETLQTPRSKHSTPIPHEFTPVSRMSLRVVKTMGAPGMEFICISWHGKHAGMSNDKKITEFTYLMIFLKEIYVKYHLPILIAGDFNVEMNLICLEVKEPFMLNECKFSRRREIKGVIDYFISTTELQLSHMKTVYLNKFQKADKPEEVLDHDPIVAMLGPAPPSDTVPSQNKAASRMTKQKTK